MIKELNYELTKKDFVKFLNFHNFKLHYIKFFLTNILILMLICIGFIAFKNPILFFVYLFLILPIALVLFFKNAYCRVLSYENIRYKLTFDSEKDTFTISNLKTEEWYWSYMKKIYNTKHNILIYLTKNSAIIIPKRIFKDEQELNETWSLIQECYNKSR